MHKWIAVLSSLLAAQLVLAVAIHFADDEHGAFEPTEDLLSFDSAQIDGLRIEDGEANTLLTKRDGGWVLPELDDFPADQDAVQQLLDALAGLKQGWPVATSAGAAERFKVDPEAFQRKLTLLSDEQTMATLYVGTSPGFRKAHVRPDGDAAVYAASFNSWEAHTKTDDWIDKGILEIAASDIERIEMSGLSLERGDDGLQLVDLGEDEETQAEAARSLVERLSKLRVQSLLGSEDQATYEQADPTLEIRVRRKDGQNPVYRLFKPEDTSHYVLKRSDLEHYVTVAESAVKALKDTTREQLVQVKEQPKEIPNDDALARPADSSSDDDGA